MKDKFFNKVMEKILFGPDEIFADLKNQFNLLEIISVEKTGVGYYVDFGVGSQNIEPLNQEIYVKSFQIGDLYGDIDDVSSAVGFILFIENGFITLLEGYTIMADCWPDENEIELIYDSGEERHIEALRRKMLKNLSSE